MRAEGHLDPAASALLSPIVLGSYALLLVVAIVLCLRYRRRAARAEAAFDPTAPLEPGEALLLGTVEHAHGEETAVRVEVTQEGSESESSGAWSHTWTERERLVRGRPFYLRHASDRRIRVESAPCSSTTWTAASASTSPSGSGFGSPSSASASVAPARGGIRTRTPRGLGILSSRGASIRSMHQRYLLATPSVPFSGVRTR